MYWVYKGRKKKGGLWTNLFSIPNYIKFSLLRNSSFLLCLLSVEAEKGRDKREGKNHQNANQQELLGYSFYSCIEWDMYCKKFSAINSWWTTISIYTMKDTFQRPGFARFIPLELNGDTLPLGPGLSSLKFEFSKANSRNCCLLI